MNKLKLNEFSRRVFQKVDKDNSGYLEKEELRQLLIMMAKEMNTKKPTEAEVNFVMNYLDTNKDFKISQQEFVVMAELLLKILGEKK